MIAARQLFMVLITTLLAAQANAEANFGDMSADQKGLAIAEQVKARDRGWNDSRAAMEMQLYRRDKLLATREMRIQALEVVDDGDKSLTIFDTPRDVQGTAFLTFTHVLEDDEQWLYLPALKRVKQISSKNKTSPFMGSEFSYEDLNSFEVPRYSYTWLRDEPCGDTTCFVILARSKDPYTGYSKETIWIDKDEYRPLKVKYYDKRQSLLKTLTLSDYRKYLDRFWRPGKQVMVNHQSGNRTVILMKDYQFNTGLTSEDFTRNSLMRAR